MNNILSAQLDGVISGKDEVNSNTFDVTNSKTGIKDWISSATQDYAEKLQIVNGKLYYIGTDDNEIKWAKEINMYAEVETEPLSNKAVLGKYVYYTPDGGTYTGATSAITGHTTNQEFTVSNTQQLWRVLSNDGTNVTIVKDSPTGQLTLKGENGYNNAITVLNDISNLYTSSLAQSTRSIDFDDVTNVTKKFMIPGEEYNRDYFIYDGAEQMGGNTSEGYKTIFGNDSNLNYWLADRYSERIRIYAI